MVSVGCNLKCKIFLATSNTIIISIYWNVSQNQYVNWYVWTHLKINVYIIYSITWF